MKIYTRTGDDGTTGLLGNSRVKKDDPRIEAVGAVDELNASVGVVIAHLPIAAQKVRPWLDTIQSDLFVIGALLATPEGAGKTFATLPPTRVTALEEQIDQMETDLPALKNFILPQGNTGAAFTHLARAVGRRSERRIVTLAAQHPIDALVITYINRLADFLFVLARWINKHEGGLETAWIPNPSAAGKASAAPAPGPDRLDATLKKLEHEKQGRQTLFEKAAAEMQKKKEQADRAFRQGVDQIKKDGGKVEPPPSPFDLD